MSGICTKWPDSVNTPSGTMAWTWECQSGTINRRPCAGYFALKKRSDSVSNHQTSALPRPLQASRSRHQSPA
jgi:hypothetical protein